MALRLAPLPSHSSLVAPRCTARRQPHVRLAAQPEGGAPEPSTPPEAAPQETPQSSGRAVAGAAAAFGAALFFLSRATGGPSLSQLEADSLPIDQALRNGRPSVLEFYADWCEVCRESAPNVYDVERAQKGSLNFVMLNVDNVKWAPEMSEYDVDGIPHFVFLDKDGRKQGTVIGRLPKEVLARNAAALLAGQPLPFQKYAGASSGVVAPDVGGGAASSDPRAHAW